MFSARTTPETAYLSGVRQSLAGPFEGCLHESRVLAEALAEEREMIPACSGDYDILQLAVKPWSGEVTERQGTTGFFQHRGRLPPEGAAPARRPQRCGRELVAGAAAGPAARPGLTSALRDNGRWEPGRTVLWRGWTTGTSAMALWLPPVGSAVRSFRASCEPAPAPSSTSALS